MRPEGRRGRKGGSRQARRGQSGQSGQTGQAGSGGQAGQSGQNGRGGQGESQGSQLAEIVGRVGEGRRRAGRRRRLRQRPREAARGVPAPAAGDQGARRPDAPRRSGLARRRRGLHLRRPTSAGLSAPGTEAFKQDFAKWEELRRQATQALDNVESSLSKKLQAKQATRPPGRRRRRQGAGRLPEAGRQLLQGDGEEEEAMISGSEAIPVLTTDYDYDATACTLPIRFPWWLAVLLAAAIAAVAYGDIGARSRR